MKTIIFPATNRVHAARQQLLLDALSEHYNVIVWEPATEPGSMESFSIVCAIEFNNFLAQSHADAVLIRGDRYEMLGLAMIAAYRDIPVLHIEGGDLSGVIDNKVRHAITALADYHFATNAEAYRRLINMGVPIDRVWNFGSLDVEFASKVAPTEKTEDYIFVAYHPIDGEDEEELTQALDGYVVKSAVSNKDYGRQYGDETYTPEAYINMLRNAKCLVGNSSSLLKEASILGTPVVLVGDRQKNRLMPKNVLQVPCHASTIRAAIEFQMNREFAPDTVYFKPETSKQIANQIKELI